MLVARSQAAPAETWKPERLGLLGRGGVLPAPKSASGLVVVLVIVLGAGFGVFPPETPSRGRATNGVLGNPVPWLFAGWRQRSTLPLVAGVGWGGLDDGSLMVVTQCRLLVVSLRVLVDKDAPGGGSGVVVDGVPHLASPRVEQRSRPPGTSGPFPPRNGPSHLLGYSRPLKGLGRLDPPPTAATRPMASPASAAPFEWVLAGGVEAAVVGRVIDG